MSNPFHVVTIESEELGRDMRVWLDGIPVKGLRQLEVRSSVQDATEITFTIIANLGDVKNKVT